MDVRASHGDAPRFPVADAADDDLAAKVVHLLEGRAGDGGPFVGDDLPDLPLLHKVGWPVAVANAIAEVKAAARHTTRLPGGSGAVREAVEWLLDQQQLRHRALEAFLNRAQGFSVDPEERR